jgi:hypothetical protein
MIEQSDSWLSAEKGNEKMIQKIKNNRSLT